MDPGVETGRLPRRVEEGLEQGLARLRKVLLARLEQRFGPLPEETRRRVEVVGSFEDLADLIVRAEVAPSLEALGLS